jgi:anti-sigma regulatory factor (Ser/Thr protein kinase)/serine/threonine protein phosphatase PrpC
MAKDSVDPLRSGDIKVQWPADIRRAGEAARAFADSAGFPPLQCEEICLVATELASNLLRHASEGTIRLSRIEAEDRGGIQIDSEDSGPGIDNVEQAISDGYSTAGGPGIGLGTVNRLMDEVEFSSARQTGLLVVCKRWRRPNERGDVGRELAFGAATRPFRHLLENGDAFIIKQWPGHALVGVIDGLGHGQFAQRASQAARHYIEQHFDQPLESLFRGTGRVCQATRGVVMALAQFDLAEQKLRVASIGNIEVRLIGGTEKSHCMVRRGVLGMNAPNPISSEHAWTSSSLLIMHSDGLRTHWDWDDFRELAQETPSVIAQRLLEALGKPDDDATVVVARSPR